MALLHVDYCSKQSLPFPWPAWSTRPPAAPKSHDKLNVTVDFVSFFSVRAAEKEVGVCVFVWSRCERLTGTQGSPVRRTDSSPAASWRLRKHKQTRKESLANGRAHLSQQPADTGSAAGRTVDAELAVRALRSLSSRGSVRALHCWDASYS